MGALGENFTLFIKPIDTTNAFGIHKVSGIPTARGIDHDIIWSLIGRFVLGGGVQRGRKATWAGDTKSCKPT